MKIIKAAAMGMCFGVRDALEMLRTLPDPQDVTVYGELVHNSKVLSEISIRGFRQVSENQRHEIPGTSSVLVTAHGVSNKTRGLLADSGREVIDTTCPLVKRAHNSALLLHKRGYFVIVIGKRDHVEVIGLTGDLEQYEVVSCVDEVRNYGQERIGVIAQTTTPPRNAQAILEAINSKNPNSEVRFVDTICQPTRERQEAAEKLLRQVNALVVVGGRHSNNTRQLVELANARGIAVQHVEDASHLDREALRQFREVGLTAGTSTLEETIREVESALEAI